MLGPLKEELGGHHFGYRHDHVHALMAELKYFVLIYDSPPPPSFFIVGTSEQEEKEEEEEQEGTGASAALERNRRDRSHSVGARLDGCMSDECGRPSDDVTRLGGAGLNPTGVMTSIVSPRVIRLM
ncbi:hypothetical protein Trydic_g15684 [Trypoxylus dichotomus]